MKHLCRKFSKICGVLLTIFIFKASAFACSCYPTETVDKEFAKTPNVVVVKLQSIKPIENAPTKFLLSVERVYKGELKRDELLTFQYGSNCTFGFGDENIGSEYLLYLGQRPEKNESWQASICTRSGMLENVQNDLRYLDNAGKLSGKTRLSGRFLNLTGRADEDDDPSPLSLAGKTIRVVGKGKTVKIKTDRNGFFEIYELPPGKYKIFPEKIDGYTFHSETSGFAEIEIKAKSQTEHNFFYEIDNQISGKILDRDGKPIEGVCVNLYSLKAEKILGFAHRSCTDEDGEFMISGIPIGTYNIVVNAEDAFDRFSRNPFIEKFYYPNAKTLDKAAAISVEANYFLKNLLLVPPEIQQTITMTGRLTYSDGKPATDEVVQFVKSEESAEIDDGLIVSEFEAVTDKNGTFTIKILKGQKGILRGSLFTNIEASKNCPEILKILETKGQSIQQLETNRFEVTGSENLTGIELKFPFPFCKEAQK